MAARRGFTIVSGGALGIDAAAHRGALEAGAPTFAVLGCGVDVVYPDRHAALFAEIVAAGGLLSEFAPGTPPRGKQFPSRNRIVAALAEAVLVVEAQAGVGRARDGAAGAGLGRPLYAVPGSAGTDRLIASGKARPVRDGAELLGALGRRGAGRRARFRRSFVRLLGSAGGRRDRGRGGAPAGAADSRGAGAFVGG